MEAIERYDDDKNVPFRVYAELGNGAMLDFYVKKIGCLEIFVSK